MTLEELEVHMESTNQENVKEYLQKYEYIAKYLKSIFLRKIAKKHKSKKTNVQSNYLVNILK